MPVVGRSVTTGALLPLGPHLKDKTTEVVPDYSRVVGSVVTTGVGTIVPHTMWPPITMPSGKKCRIDDAYLYELLLATITLPTSSGTVLSVSGPSSVRNGVTEKRSELAAGP